MRFAALTNSIEAEPVCGLEMFLSEYTIPL